MNIEEARELLKKYIENECTPQERALVERWYQNEAEKQELRVDTSDVNQAKDQIWSGMMQKIRQSDRPGRVVKIWMTSAAAVLVFLAGGFFYLHQKMQPVQKASVRSQSDAEPGGNKAILTLSDGSKIVLDHAGNGTLARQGNIVIKKAADGKLIYDATKSDLKRADGVISYNTIATPRGGEYQVILPDGSKVWLNSASSIKFPTSFSAKQRNVSITGEAYFEVASNPGKPFNVKAGDTNVQVLGTHFNIMAYADEAGVKTTLLEGSVKVSSGDQSTIIKPGQQAATTDGQINISQANLEQATAWKNGYFYFKNTDIQEAMRQISRWYDVDVDYRGKVPETVFTGKMYKNVNASKVLDVLNYFKIDFAIEEPALPSGKKTIVIL